MKRAEENYFIETFTEPFQIEKEELYRLGMEMASMKIKGIAIPDSRCVSLLLMDEECRLYRYHIDDKKYRKLPIVLTETQLPLQLSFMDDRLLLRYADRIDIIAMDTEELLAIPVTAEKITTGGNRIYVQKMGEKDVTVFDVTGTQTEIISVAGTLIGLDFTKTLHLLTAKNSRVYLDGTFCRNVKSDITAFAMLEAGDFIAGYANQGIYHYQSSKKILRPFFTKKVQSLETDCMGRVWALSEESVFRFEKRCFYEASSSLSKIFDSYKEETRWHALVMEADIPSETSVQITVSDGEFTNSYTNVKDVLLYGYKGQNLTVTLILKSDSSRQNSPAVHSIKVIFDKTSYTEYLPAYYRETPETLHRFLSLFQNIMDETEKAIEKTPRIIDVTLTEESFLGWLSRWLGMTRDYRWPEDKWRHFLLKAPLLYQKTGTKEGLRELIEIYSGQKPEIVEYSEDGKRFFFCVKLDPDTITTEIDIEVINAIIEAFKPSHTQGRVVVDFGLNDTTDLIIGESVLPFNTVIE